MFGIYEKFQKLFFSTEESYSKVYSEYYCDLSSHCSVNSECSEGQIPFRDYNVFNYTSPETGRKKTVGYDNLEGGQKCLTPLDFFKEICSFGKEYVIQVNRIEERSQDLVSAEIENALSPRKAIGNPDPVLGKILYFHTSKAHKDGYYQCIMKNHDAYYSKECENIPKEFNCRAFKSVFSFDSDGQILGHDLALPHHSE